MTGSYRSLKGKIAVVTGASSGIGRAIAYRFADAGASVALIARRKNRLEEAAGEIQKRGSKALVVAADLDQPSEIERAFQEIRQKWGDPGILVNNAGRGTAYGSLTERSLEDYESVFNLNVRALFLATREVLPAMIQKRTGTIVNIASIAGKVGLANIALYCASKFAVMGLSEALLEEVREKNIRVAAICPGMVNTEFFDRLKVEGDRKRFIQPEDVAEAVLLCASDTQTAAFSEIIIRPRRPLG